MTQDSTMQNEIQLPDIIAVLDGRERSYRMFSSLFLGPLDEAGIGRVASANLIKAASTLDDDSDLTCGLAAMGRDLHRRNTGTRQRLATDFTMCFDGVSSIDDEVAVPYASVYLSESGLLNQEPRSAVYRLYLSEATKLAPGINLPEDHLAFELEFLALLSQRASSALAQPAPDASEARRLMELSRTFITEHILTWYDQFAGRAQRVLKTQFYRGLLKATRGYLDLDLEMTADIIEALA